MPTSGPTHTTAEPREIRALEVERSARAPTTASASAARADSSSRPRSRLSVDINHDIDLTLHHQIAHTDREIDALVYELYVLVDQEIALVESATRPN